MPEDNQSPNIVFLLTDDQGPWAMHCAGCHDLVTPNLDRLARRGLRFDNFFCASPVCSPARASILTGRIPSQHGIHDYLAGGNCKLDRGNGRLIEYLKGQPGYTDVLAAHGYTCGLCGKWHMGDVHHAQKGFSYWRPLALGGKYYNALVIRDGEAVPEPDYITDVITNDALDFLKSRQDDHKPFYLGVHYTAPHTSWARDQHPRAAFDRYINECGFTSVPNEPRHPWAIKAPTMYPADAGQRRLHLSGYFTAITEMDRNLGRILDYLDLNHLTDNTLVVFMSDNGMNMGHNGVWGKGNGTFPLNLYENSVKVPCIMALPGRIPAGTVNSELLSQYDFMPTLLDYLGLPHPNAAGLPGRSFAGLLRGEPAAGRENVVVFDEYGPARMIRSREFKYIHRYPYGPHEFYDLKNDPNETRNLADDAGFASIIASMRLQLGQWFGKYVNPELDGARLPVKGSGQVDLAGSGSEGRLNFNARWPRPVSLFGPGVASG